MVLPRVEPREARIYPDLARASAALGEALVGVAESSVRERGHFRWVISGGRTPLGLFGLLRGPLGRRLPWRESELFFADERCVPPGDPRSNFGEAWSAFLSKVPIPRAHIHRMRGELRPSSEAARRYARQIGPVPRDAASAARLPFDLVLLGIGPDGHTASLFPGQAAVRERRRAVVAVRRGGLEPYVPRLTLTPPALSATRAAWFLVDGPDKADAVAGIFRTGAAGDPRLPGSLIRPPAPVVWFLDRSAAAGLPRARRGSAPTGA